MVLFVTTGRLVYWFRMLMISCAFPMLSVLNVGIFLLITVFTAHWYISTATSSRFGNWKIGEPKVVSITRISQLAEVAGSIVKVFSVQRSPVYSTVPSGVFTSYCTLPSICPLLWTWISKSSSFTLSPTLTLLKPSRRFQPI